MPEPSKHTSIGAGRAVLVVDDETGIRELLVTTLERQGFSVTAAASVNQALATIAEQQFDIVVCDKNLEDGSGLEVVRALVAEHPDVRTIIVTAHGTMESALESMRLGVAGYLEKPLDLDELHSCLRRVVELQSLERDNRRLLEELAAKNQTLARLAVRDPLTRLFNHAYLQECIEREVGRSQRHHLEFSLLFADLDNFKQVNDQHGHVVGDRALQKFAGFLQGEAQHDIPGFCLRAQDIAARYGGDEFAILLPDTSKVGAAAKAEQLRALVDQYDFAAAGLPPLKVSIGVASYPGDASDRVQLIEAADTALYAAKRTSRNRVVTFSEYLVQMNDGGVTLPTSEVERLEALEESIANRHFDFVYQPIVVAETGEVFGYEALCRPRHPAFLGPMSLIETAARAGRISALGRALRSRSIRAIERLPAEVNLFVNLHPHEVTDPELIDQSSYFAPWASRIVFEITETSAVRDYGRLRELIDSLRQVGFRFALDDLGAGYSGLNSLALLAPDFVKLDSFLVREVGQDPRTARLVKHIVEFARGEKIGVIAEGVETQAERDAMVASGCGLLQGYFYGKGQPLE